MSDTDAPTDVAGSQGIENQESCSSGQRSQSENRNRAIIVAYLVENVAEFRKLNGLRKKGWNSKYGDRFFERQRAIADNPDTKAVKHFYYMMGKIGNEIHLSTGAFRVSRSREDPMILDMCMAPGGFVKKALELNPKSRALAFSLPPSKGGHEVLLPESPKVALRFLDITMLAADMGVAEIPADHPDAKNFLPQQFQSEQLFDLIFCDGQVLRTHERAAYRNCLMREPCRLTVTQLALGLEHVRENGTMIVLLHKLESWESVQVLYTFSKFCSVRVFKPGRFHAKRSSFYMVATKIQNRHPEAVLAVSRWKQLYRAATFGTDEEYKEENEENGLRVETVLEEFGPELVRLGRDIWNIQAAALAKAPFMKDALD
ncbi:hypothetical protein AJ79_09273 [Helicocarpus griseus UAMH5409]|uniref:Ribosomal RNA methyltransferase FtsJ domain-containing protein n=1 Tax=Helicocarpus griseus UAMH5409 TaxID=1447875 RepID=A0A2B7WLA0_9EURO|nr:hypothetical protein AJ79_09273 [Helicocarpus griseus UAMH5409]